MCIADGYLKLIDLGFAKRIHSGCTANTLCGTPEYMAPEIVLRKGHTNAVDYWALGVLLFEMLTRDTPYGGDADGDLHQIYEEIVNGKLVFPKRFALSTDVKACISSLLVVNPKRRLGYGANGISDLQQHSWFGDFSWDVIEQRTEQAPHLPKTPELPKCNTTYFEILREMGVRVCSTWNPNVTCAPVNKAAAAV